MKLHPAATAFPLIEGAEFDQLVASIRDNGFDPQFPITRWRGQTIDGRNRERAAKTAGVAPKYKDLADDADPWMFAWRANAVRRHLPADQKAAIYISILKGSGEFARRQKEKESAKRAGVTVAGGGRGRKKTLPSDDGKVCRAPTVAAEIGAEIGVSAKTIERVLKLEREAPEAFEAVKKGETTAGKAAAALKPKTEKPASSRAGTARPRTSEDVGSTPTLPVEPTSSPRPSSQSMAQSTASTESDGETPEDDWTVHDARVEIEDAIERAVDRCRPQDIGTLLGMIGKWHRILEAKHNEFLAVQHSA